MLTRDIIFASCLILIMLIMFWMVYENHTLRKKLESYRAGTPIQPELLPRTTNRLARVTININPTDLFNDQNMIQQEPDPTLPDQPEPEPVLPESVPIPEPGLGYFDEMAKNNHNNDSQNVHNHRIVAELKRRYTKLIELNGCDQVNQNLIAAAFAEINAEIARRLPQYTQKDQAKILKVVEVAVRGNVFSGFEEEITEDWILTQVWMRIHADANAASHQQMLAALIDQFKDSGNDIENNIITRLTNAMMGGDGVGTECMFGRVGRYFQTFTHLDVDELLQSPILDDKEFENEAFEKSYHILSKALEDHPAAKLYTMPEDELDVDELSSLEAFKVDVRKSIDTNIRQDYAGILPDDAINSIVVKCQAGV